MDIAKLKKVAQDCRRTKEELTQMLHNARIKEDIAAIGFLEDLLKTRFNISSTKQKSKGDLGPQKTFVKYKNERFEAKTSKEAYIWLIAQFYEDFPNVLDDGGWQNHFVADGRYANLFARDLETLFRRSPHLSDDPNNFTIIGRGWYVNLNLSNKQKLSSVSRYAAIAGLKYGVDYQWEPEKHDGASLDDL